MRHGDGRYGFLQDEGLGISIRPSKTSPRLQAEGSLKAPPENGGKPNAGGTVERFLKTIEILVLVVFN